MDNISRDIKLTARNQTRYKIFSLQASLFSQGGASQGLDKTKGWVMNNETILIIVFKYIVGQNKECREEDPKI